MSRVGRCQGLFVFVKRERDRLRVCAGHVIDRSIYIYERVADSGWIRCRVCDPVTEAVILASVAFI